MPYPTTPHTPLRCPAPQARLAWPLCFAVLTALAACGGGEDLAAPDASRAAAEVETRSVAAAAAPDPACTAGSSLNVVAHEDDDLLFLNPDIARDIAAGRCVRTVFLTAGDNNLGANYWQGREAGIQAAYAVMAGAPNTWVTTDAGIPGKPAVMRLLSGSRVSVVFMRLPDGQGNGAGSSNNAFESLQKLYQGSIASIRAVDGSASYNKAGLTSAIASLITNFGPGTVRTQNFNGAYGDGDHSDHLSASYLVREASAQSGVPHTLVAYADYVTSTYPSNVTGADLAIKQSAWNAYVVYDREPCGAPPACNGNLYDQWLSRQYTTGSLIVGPALGPNLALGRPATASSVEVAGFEAGKAVDGDGGTRWSSAYADNQWLQVDLGATTTIDTVEVSWEAAYASRYRVQTSTDGVNWITVATATPASAGTQRLSFAAIAARYVRIACDTRATGYGFSIYELRVHRSGSTPPAPPLPPGTATSCANEGGTCTIPAGRTATVWYGAGTGWAQKTGVTGSIGCSNAVFGDPAPGTGKVCLLLLDTAPTNVAPTVALTAPAQNASITQGSAINVAASAVDSDGTVTKVEFFDGSSLIGTDTTSPYALTWTATAAGAHTLTARATDNAGATTTSAAVVVTVVASGTGTAVSPLFGSATNGTPFTDPVATGQTLTGIVVRAGWWVDSIQGLATPSNLPAHGGTGGGTSTATLAAGEYLVRLYGKTGGGVVAQLSFVTNTGRVLGPYATATGVGTLTSFDYSVPAGQRVLGFTGRSGTSLHAIGVVYGPVTVGPPATVSPLFGSATNGTPFTDPAATGQTLTGVVVRAGWWVDSIQGLATPSNLPAHGGTGGGTSTATLAAGEHLVRLYGKTGGGVVAQLSFVTNTGRVLGPYATATGVGTLTSFDYSVPAGQRVLGFTGRSGTSLNAIGVVYGP